MVSLRYMPQGLIKFSTLLLLSLLYSMAGHAAELASSIDRNELGLGETLELSVVYSGQSSEKPDFSSLNHQFEILGTNQRSNISMINGSFASTTTWQLTLLPKSAGAAVIPTFHLKGNTSDAIELKVRDDTANPGSSASGAQSLFTEVTLDKTSLYVQEQALLTVRLYTRVSLNGYSLSPLEIPNTRIVKVSEEQQYRKQIGSHPYMVIESRYALFPEKSGEINIPALRFNVSVVEEGRRARFDSFFESRGKAVYLHSDPLVMEVKPAPELTGSDHWLPANNLTLSQTWQPDINPPEHSTANLAANLATNLATIGEPITRTITITAEGLTAAQLQALEIPDGGQYRLYSDQAITADKLALSGVSGERIEGMAIVPTQTGLLELPDIKLRWWDTGAKRFREASVPGASYQVLPAAHSSPNELSPPAIAADITGLTISEQDTTTLPKNSVITPWLLASNLLFLLTTLVFALLWWRRRRTAPESVLESALKSMKPDTSKAFNAVLKAANTDSLGALREAIIHWGRLHWNAPDIVTLQQVAAHSEHPALLQHFSWLDKHIYSNTSLHAAEEDSNQASDELAMLVEILKQVNKSTPGKPILKGSELKALYPQ